MITILSLLEGRTDNYIVSRLIRAFNMDILKENLKNIYMNYVEFYGPSYYNNDIFDHTKHNENYNFSSSNNPQDKNPEYYSVIIETGFMIYNLIKTFSETTDLETQQIIAEELETLSYSKTQEKPSIFTNKTKRTYTDLSTEGHQQSILTYNYNSYSKKFEKNNKNL